MSVAPSVNTVGHAGAPWAHPILAGSIWSLHTNLPSGQLTCGPHEVISPPGALTGLTSRPPHSTPGGALARLLLVTGSRGLVLRGDQVGVGDCGDLNGCHAHRLNVGQRRTKTVDDPGKLRIVNLVVKVRSHQTEEGATRHQRVTASLVLGPYPFNREMFSYSLQRGPPRQLQILRRPEEKFDVIQSGKVVVQEIKKRIFSFGE
mmetsp:Transcript_33767/g.66842  ORF Transcript_33767/g.66842 Transcript_33767/m.66842 type:complete len:204 (+) Transcript_33767:249-860(+)